MQIKKKFRKKWRSILITSITVALLVGIAAQSNCIRQHTNKKKDCKGKCRDVVFCCIGSFGNWSCSLVDEVFRPKKTWVDRFIPPRRYESEPLRPFSQPSFKDWG